MESGQQWGIERKKDGETTWRGPKPIPFDTGKSRIEGDLICTQFQKNFWGLEYCLTVFRKSGAPYEGKDEYFNCTDFGLPLVNSTVSMTATGFYFFGKGTTPAYGTPNSSLLKVLFGPGSSFLRKQECSLFSAFWTSPFAGVKGNWSFSVSC
jgi:hypothetical protein